MHPIPEPVSTSEPAPPAVVVMPTIRPPADVLVSVCAAYGVTIEALVGQTRSKWLTKARTAAATELREMGLSLQDIGGVMNRHHTSILYLLGGVHR